MRYFNIGPVQTLRKRKGKFIPYARHESIWGDWR